MAIEKTEREVRDSFAELCPHWQEARLFPWAPLFLLTPCLKSKLAMSLNLLSLSLSLFPSPSLSPPVCKSVCVYLCVGVCICVCTLVRMLLHHPMGRVWRSEDNLRCQPSPSTLFGTRFPVHCWAVQVRWPRTVQDSPAAASHVTVGALGLETYPTPSGFTGCSRDPGSALMLCSKHVACQDSLAFKSVF